MTATLTLRGYQQEAIDTVFAEEAAKVLRQLIVLPTGAGKTAVATRLMAEWIGRHLNDSDGRAIWLTHRNELVDQTLEAIRMWCSADLTIGVVKAERNQLGCPITVASVQTLAVAGRMEQLLEHGPYGLVISDEHHLSPAPTWSRVLDQLGCGKPDGPLMVGLTATPDRADRVGLKVTTDKIVYAKDIIWGISEGYLVPPKGITVKVDLTDVKISRGDYTDGSLSDVLELGGAHIAVARLIQEHAADRKTIVFTPTVRFAQLVADECNKLEMVAEMVEGNTPLDDRRKMYQRLRSGETRIIANCAVLAEGFDEPSVDCIVNARPTRSRATFTQRVGRGLRTYPGKEDCLVIALAGSERNKLATVASLAGRTYEQAMKAREERDETFDFAEAYDEAVRDEAERAQMKVRTVDLLTQVRRSIAWAVVDEHCFVKAIPREVDHRNAAVIVKEDWRQTGWRVVGVWKSEGRWKHKRLIDGVDLTTAQGFADNLVRERIPPELLDTSACWRRENASVGQLAALSKWHVRHDGFLTKGEASDMLDVAVLKTVAVSV